MFDDIVAHYLENVVQSFVAYRAADRSKSMGQSRDLRLSLAAASTLFHFREHLPKNISISRKKLEIQFPDYGVLADIVNAAKHGEITNDTPHGAPYINKAEQIAEQKNVIFYEDRDGMYSYTYKSVVASLNNGNQVVMLKLLISVLNFWENYLFLQGILSKARTFKYIEKIRYRKRSECKKINFQFEVIAGQRIHMVYKVLKFNKNTNSAEPMDLTGWGARGSIYKPSYCVDVSLTHNITGEKIDLTVNLTAEESEYLAKFRSDKKRNSLIYTLESVKAAINNTLNINNLKNDESGT